MAGKSKSERRQRKERVRTRDKWLDRAVDVWKLEQDKPKPLSLEKICAQVEKEYFTETGQTIKLSSSTLDRRVKGGQSHQQAGEKFAWLTKGQTKEVVTYIQESAARGFPLSHRRIKEHVDEIARATWGEKFPEKGVGKAWTDRCVSKSVLQSQIGTDLPSALFRITMMKSKPIGRVHLTMRVHEQSIPRRRLFSLTCSGRSSRERVATM